MPSRAAGRGKTKAQASATWEAKDSRDEEQAEASPAESDGSKGSKLSKNQKRKMRMKANVNAHGAPTGSASAAFVAFVAEPADKLAAAGTTQEEGMDFAQAIVSADAKRAADAKSEEEKRVGVAAQMQAKEASQPVGMALAEDTAPQAPPRVGIVSGPSVAVFGPRVFEAGAAYPLPKREAPAAYVEAVAAGKPVDKLAPVRVHSGPTLLETSEVHQRKESHTSFEAVVQPACVKAVTTCQAAEKPRENCGLCVIS